MLGSARRTRISPNEANAYLALAGTVPIYEKTHPLFYFGLEVLHFAGQNPDIVLPKDDRMDRQRSKETQRQPGAERSGAPGCLVSIR